MPRSIVKGDIVTTPYGWMGVVIYVGPPPGAVNLSGKAQVYVRRDRPKEEHVFNPDQLELTYPGPRQLMNDEEYNEALACQEAMDHVANS